MDDIMLAGPPGSDVQVLSVSWTGPHDTEKSAMVECLTLGSHLHREKPGTGVQGRGGVCEGARGGGRQGDPGPRVSGAVALESAPRVGLFPHSPSLLPSPPPFLFSFLPPSLPNVCVPALRQAGHWA